MDPQCPPMATVKDHSVDEGEGGEAGVGHLQMEVIKRVRMDQALSYQLTQPRLSLYPRPFKHLSQNLPFPLPLQLNSQTVLYHRLFASLVLTVQTRCAGTRTHPPRRLRSRALYCLRKLALKDGFARIRIAS